MVLHLAATFRTYKLSTLDNWQPRLYPQLFSLCHTDVSLHNNVFTPLKTSTNGISIDTQPLEKTVQNLSTFIN